MAEAHDPRAQCIGKVRYRTRRWAKSAIVRMRSQGRHTAGLSDYLCPHCGMFHIGNRAGMLAAESRRSA